MLGRYAANLFVAKGDTLEGWIQGLNFYKKHQLWWPTNERLTIRINWNGYFLIILADLSNKFSNNLCYG